MKRKVLITFGVTALLLAPFFVSAQEGFVQCGQSAADPCELCDAVGMLDRILNWLITILSVVVAIVFIVAGLQLVTSAGNTAAKESAKKRITNTVIGFVIVLGAWVIIDLFMQALADPSIFSGEGPGVPWQVIECVGQPAQQYEAAVLLPGSSGGSTSLTFGPSCNPGTSNFPACATAPAASGVTVDTSNLSSTCNPGTSNFPDCAQVSGVVGSSGSDATPLSITIDGTAGSPNAITVDPSASYAINDPAMPEYGLDAGENHGNSLTIIGTQSEGGMVRVTDNTTGQTFMIGCALVSPPITGC